jgi:hypothetical protein
MRAALLAASLLIVPAVATGAGWDHYENARFGYEVDVPEGFAGRGEADNGDGQVFAGPGGDVMRVYGGNNIAATFEASVEAAMGYAEDAGWALSYQRVTPTWASYSGTRNGRILYARAIALCGGQQFASFELEYPQRELEPMNSVVEHLVRSLKATGTGIGC